MIFAYRSLNSNRFTGSIPASIGNLKNLYWLDLTDNQLTGNIPVSDGIKPGLDMLTHAKHLYVCVYILSELKSSLKMKLYA